MERSQLHHCLNHLTLTPNFLLLSHIYHKIYLTSTKQKYYDSKNVSPIIYASETKWQKRIFYYFIKTANERREDTVKLKEIVRQFEIKTRLKLDGNSCERIQQKSANH